jgi:hypothetical protein
MYRKVARWLSTLTWVNNPDDPMTGNETYSNVYAPEGKPGAGGQSLQDQSTQALGLLNQGQPQPTAPAPQQNKGLISQGLDSLKSIGRGMGDYAGKLFDDPNRMALLQGGLSMMDPNSYYDKQGFGSVFTGLNKGLGAAQAGQKGVFDRRQAGQYRGSSGTSY